MRPPACLAPAAVDGSGARWGTRAPGDWSPLRRSCPARPPGTSCWPSNSASTRTGYRCWCSGTARCCCRAPGSLRTGGSRSRCPGEERAWPDRARSRRDASPARWAASHSSWLRDIEILSVVVLFLFQLGDIYEAIIYSFRERERERESSDPRARAARTRLQWIRARSRRSRSRRSSRCSGTHA